MIKNKLTILSSALCLSLLSACSSTSENSQILPASINITQILAAKDNWSFEFAKVEYLDEVTSRIIYLSENKYNNQELDSLLYYLRGFSYYGDTKQVSDSSWLQLDYALTALNKSGLLNLDNGTNARLVEHYAVTLYRFYNQDILSAKVGVHLNTLSQLVQLPINVENYASQYAKWEVIRSMAFLTYEAKNNKLLANAILASQNWLSSLKALTKQSSWQAEHALWALAYQHKILNEDEKKQLDTQVWQLVDNMDLELNKKQFLFSQRYLVNSFRGLSECNNDFLGKCSFPTIDDALPINHQCSDSLFIRATEMNKSQLEASCNKLTSQESHFHSLLNTKKQPAANDHNQSLRVVIFDNYSQYNQYGQMVFDINTDNGGMYIEGTPSDPNNQATFYSYEVFWQRPDFKVWNLNHEYVHYLDGRFSKYGSFGHFPSHLVWWSEGVAELVSRQKVNPKAYQEAKETAKENWPTLEEIFATTYNDGSKRVYKWSYLAINYLSQVDLQGVQLLSQHLKNDFFDGYKTQLDNLAKKHQTGFVTFLDKQLKNGANKDLKIAKDKKPKKLYRYLYRDYLMPHSLKLTQRHNHIL